MKSSVTNAIVMFGDIFELVLDIAWKVSLIVLSIHIIRLENMY